MLRTLVWIAVAVVIVFGGYRLLRTTSDPRSRDASGHCLLRARVYTFGEGTAQPRRVFGMQNLDEADWTDVQATIEGIVTSGPQANRPSGVFVQKLPAYDSTVAPKKVREVPLDDFKNADGPRWVPMTMRAAKAHVEARIGAEKCTYDSPLPEPH